MRHAPRLGLIVSLAIVTSWSWTTLAQVLPNPYRIVDG